MNDIYEQEILGKLDIISANKPRIFEAGKAEGIEQGKQAERKRFWDVLQKGGLRNIYYNAFSSSYYASAWTDEIFNPQYEINCTGSIDNGARNTFFSSVYLTDIKVPVNVKGVVVSQTFGGCERLIRIPLLKVNEQTTWLNSFLRCFELQELTIEGTIGQGGLDLKDSTKLTKASIESVINALDITEGRPATTVTLSLAAVTAAFGDVSGYNDEFDNLCASARTANWTISLV